MKHLYLPQTTLVEANPNEPKFQNNLPERLAFLAPCPLDKWQTWQ